MFSTVLIDDKTLKEIISGIWFYVGKEALKYPNKELNAKEWSEEDEDTYKRVYSLFEQSINRWYDAVFAGCYPKKTREKVLSMLKSLHPVSQ